ncbi:N-acetylneuraminate epimerase [Dyadobacter sp. CECT 9623]|uniref:N-acetylneuraminate epimerase n=1 Tax=Dyadobacter linearis TaxID=2823330 RepID=A0ABN7RB56_9BACT|nr:MULTISPECIES: kelch repeat-containing protein [unclassified Dyadobacter]MCE7059686.1 galactose oxidase [Dyadobacter sp. CY343]CAG5072029.1 N-acetylneuraminate epimerase [Dyadobacter sp. CECT 9623]
MFNTLKKTSLAILVASVAIVSFSCKDDDPEADKMGNWYRRDLPSFGGSGRTRSVSFVIGEVGYIGTGYTNETVPRVKDFWAFNAGSKIWSQVAPFPGTGRADAAAFVLDGKAYVGTGYDDVRTVDNGYKKDFYQFDPAANRWKAIADFPGTRQGATAFVANNKGYVGLGYNGSNYFQDFYEYNPATDKWTEIATFIGGKRSGATSFSVAGKAYVGFGRSNSTAFTNDLYSFDAAGNAGRGAWSRIAFPNDDVKEAFTTRTNATAFVLGEKAYIIGGENKSDVWEFVPGTNTWTEMAPFAGLARGYAAGFAIGNVGYFGTGSASGSAGTDDFWAFDPAAATNDDDNQ